MFTMTALRLVFAVITAIFLLSFTAATSCWAAQPPKYAFALTNSHAQNLDALLSNKNIDGIALQEVWAVLEPQEGQYHFEALDLALKCAAAKKKLVSLHVMASPRVPMWLNAAGAEFFNGVDFRGRRVVDVVPWDKVYLEKFGHFLNKLSEHLRQQRLYNSVFALGVVVPVAEMNLIGCHHGKLGSVSYDRSAYLAACKTMIAKYSSSFPQARKFISPPMRDLVCFPVQDREFYRELMIDSIRSYGTTCWMFAADLNAEGSERTRNYLDLTRETGLGYQTIWSSTNDPSLRMKGFYPQNLRLAIMKGIENGAEYFEVYAVDVLNPSAEIQGALGLIHGN